MLCLRFQKVVMDNANSRLPESHHNFLLVQFWFLENQDQAIQLIIYYCCKEFILHHKSLFNQEMDHSNFIDAVSNTLQNTDFCQVHVEPIYRVSSPCQFSCDGRIFLKCWHPLSETFLWHGFCSTNVFRCRLSIVYWLPLLPRSSRPLSPVWNFINQYHTVWTPALLMLAALWEALWLNLNSCKSKHISSFFVFKMKHV